MKNFIFETLFNKSEGRPISYKEKTLYLYDYITVNRGETIKVKLLSTNSEHKQSFSVSVIEPKGKKCLELRQKKSSGFIFWEDTFPEEGAEITVLKDNAKIAVWNGWEETFGGINRVLNAMKNAAMWIEQKENKRIYHCNDGSSDIDFEDLIFEIEIVKRK